MLLFSFLDLSYNGLYELVFTSLFEIETLELLFFPELNFKTLLPEFIKFDDDNPFKCIREMIFLSSDKSTFLFFSFFKILRLLKLMTDLDDSEIISSDILFIHEYFYISDLLLFDFETDFISSMEYYSDILPIL